MAIHVDYRYHWIKQTGDNVVPSKLNLRIQFLEDQLVYVVNCLYTPFSYSHLGSVFPLTLNSLKFLSYCGNSTKSFSQRSTSSWVQLCTKTKQDTFQIKHDTGHKHTHTLLHPHTFGWLPASPELLNCDVLVFSVQVAVFVSLLLLHVFNNELRHWRKAVQ